MSKQQKNFSKYLLVDRPHVSAPAARSISAIETTISGSILILTAAVAVALRLVPYEYIGRNRVPAIVFKGLPSTFHGFVISIMFAFSGAFSALLVPNNPKISRLCRYFSTVSMASAVAFLISATFSRTS
ncbi:hypothetical protein TEA_006807 [Camellia sinensis var. sinensis]|uniref:PGG domain-containing protein n=1 Tax=Camellia sinensis var. sinensis TaxID=542762 RepID=A0A4S4EEG3_CAMSN|nr:hypothetical protein TEA_006807 [Camellia sinensis var. sinensis]